MQFISSPALTSLLLLTASSPFTSATPFVKDHIDSRDTEADASTLQNSTLAKRCDNPCGWSGQLCCAVGQTCYTDSSNQAQCGDGSAVTGAAAPSITGGGFVSTSVADGGYWEIYTTTWVDEVTKTAVYSSFVSAAGGGGATPTAAAAPTCDYAANETPCGDICCASGQYCYESGQCKDAGNGGYTTAAGGAGGSISPASRPTTISNSLTTTTISPTTTVAFQTPVPTGANATVAASGGSGGGGLSGGAIAGIVIGVLLGLALLALLCFCCIVRGLWGLIFGRRRDRRRTTETYVEEHHHHGGSAAGGRVWYGDRPARPERPVRKGPGGWGWAAAGLGALGLGLAGKRALDKRRRREEKSEISSSYYSYDYTSTSSPSSLSSQDRRTRRSSRRR